MLQKLLLPILTLVLLTSCATDAVEASRYVGVPLETLSPQDQKRAADLIAQRCGYPPLCPPEAVLERFTLSYIKLRNLVRAANGGN